MNYLPALTKVSRTVIRLLHLYGFCPGTPFRMNAYQNSRPLDMILCACALSSQIEYQRRLEWFSWASQSVDDWIERLILHYGFCVRSFTFITPLLYAFYGAGYALPRDFLGIWLTSSSHWTPMPPLLLRVLYEHFIEKKNLKTWSDRGCS